MKNGHLMPGPTELRLRAVLLKSHVKLLALGMKNSQYSMTDILGKCTEITGITYPTSKQGCEAAMGDLTQVINPTRK